MAASYPTSVKTFTTKNAGDTIQPGHINDLQDEVAAIEGGLLNGTAPLNSSNSTVAALSVTGGSTMGSLAVSSNCDIVGTLTVGALSIGNQSAIRVYSTVVDLQFTTASTFTRVLFETREYDLSSEYDSTTCQFIPKSTGVYSVTGRAWAQSTITDFQVALEVNDTIVAKTVGVQSPSYSMGQVATMLRLSSGAAGALCFKVYGGSTGRLFSGQSVTCLEVAKVYPR